MALRDTEITRVAKHAYYELQTADAADENVALGPGVPIPFLDYRTYCMHFMFPKEPYTHAVVRPLQLPDDLDPRRREQIERGIKQFNLLLSNKHFVLLFVRTIEQEVTRMQARVHFAALLSACLHSRLDHFTDVLKTLLADLIKRFLSAHSAQSGIPNHPRLLLRYVVFSLFLIASCSHYLIHLQSVQLFLLPFFSTCHCCVLDGADTLENFLLFL